MAGKLPVKDARTWKMTAVIRTQESANRVTNSKTYCWKRAKRNSLLYLSIIRDWKLHPTWAAPCCFLRASKQCTVNDTYSKWRICTHSNYMPCYKIAPNLIKI